MEKQTVSSWFLMRFYTMEFQSRRLPLRQISHKDFIPWSIAQEVTDSRRVNWHPKKQAPMTPPCNTCIRNNGDEEQIYHCASCET